MNYEYLLKKWVNTWHFNNFIAFFPHLAKTFPIIQSFLEKYIIEPTVVE